MVKFCRFYSCLKDVLQKRERSVTDLKSKSKTDGDRTSRNGIVNRTMQLDNRPSEADKTVIVDSLEVFASCHIFDDETNTT